MVDGVGEELPLASEVAVDQRLGDPRLLADPLGRRAVISRLREDLDGAAQDLLLTLLGREALRRHGRLHSYK